GAVMVRDGAASQALDESGQRPFMVIASNGMITGGRIVQHVKALVGDAATTLLFVGYQGDGTLGAQLQQGARQVRIDGQLMDVAPQVARELWDKIWRESKTPDAIAVQRDLSPEAHRSGWLGLFAQADVHKPGLSTLLYERVMDHSKWLPYLDTELVLRELRRRGLRIGVVSNVAEDLRPVFEAPGWADLVDGYTPSYDHRIEMPDVRI